MELQPITLDDVPLYESLRCDPLMMAELGGPLPREGIADKVRRDVESVKDGTAWIFNIILDGSDEKAGQVCIWESEFQGQPINEIGWMVLTRYQGQGLAGQAVREMLELARSEKRWGVIHAFPATSNKPSNALCKKLGFTRIDERDLEWSGRVLHCNHWRIDLTRSRAKRAGWHVYNRFI